MSRSSSAFRPAIVLRISSGFAFTLGLTTIIDVVVVFTFTHPVMTLLARTKFFGGGHKWSGLDPERLGAKTPWRSSVRRTDVRRRPDAATRVPSRGDPGESSPEGDRVSGNTTGEA